MHGEKRREKLLQLIKTASHPISGTTLSEHLGVSRQIVVQDIALIRAQKKRIKRERDAAKNRIFYSSSSCY